MMKKIFVGASEGFVKNFEAYLREVFASTGLRPEECKLVQRQTTSGNIVEIVAWVEPLGNAEMDAYRQRAEVAEAELARLREAQWWIPVSERLPEADKDYKCVSINVLMFDNNSACAIEGWYNFSDGEWHNYLTNEKFLQVTHWMPLPELPEVE